MIICQDKIAEDPETHGSMFVPVILASDKMMVSVATGQNEFYPLYASLGNFHNAVRHAHRNAVRHAHRNAVSLVGSLAIPKSMWLVVPFS